jgi:hypothetical protein
MSIEALDTHHAINGTVTMSIELAGGQKKTAGTPIPAVKTMPLSKNHYTTNSSKLAREIKGCWAIAATGPARR